MSRWVAEAGSWCRPHPGFEVCGDAAVAVHAEASSLWAVVDALGHGPQASASAARAAEALRQHADLPLEELFRAVHQAVAGHREVVMGVLRLDAQGLVFCGVGNVELLVPPGTSRPLSMAGTVGRTAALRLRPIPLEVRAGQRWVLTSDGVRTRQASPVLERVRGLPAVDAARELVEALGRNEDDATALVLDLREAA